MNPRILQHNIHSNNSIDTGVWYNFRTGIENIYAMDLASEFGSNIFREFNRKVSRISGASVYAFTPYDAGFRFFGEF
jgi:hypothetical protein